jgi:hypothetical protein
MTTKQDIAFERTHLERLKLAADVILSGPDDIGDVLETELTLFRDRIEHALLESGPSRQISCFETAECGLATAAD